MATGLLCRAWVGCLALLPLLAQAALPACQVTFPQGTKRVLPLAASDETRRIGLSGVDDIGAGMLFVWPEEGARFLWMKDTRVPLSAAFLDAQGVVQRIVDMQPQSLEQHGADSVRYIIEVAQGEFAGLGVVDGSRVRIDCSESG